MAQSFPANFFADFKSTVQSIPIPEQSSLTIDSSHTPPPLTKTIFGMIGKFHLACLLSFLDSEANILENYDVRANLPKNRTTL